MNSKIKAIIFDFDGLLVSSEPVWDRAYAKFLAKHGIEDRKEVSDEMTGMGLSGAVQMMKDELGLTGDLDDLVEQHRKYFYEIFSKEKDVLMPGAFDLVKECASRGLAIGLTSGGHTKVKLEEILGQVDLVGYFSVIVSSDDVERGKPAPDVYLEALRQLGLKAEDCLALEDSVNGVVAAKGAGIPVFGVNADAEMRSDLVKAKADRVYESLEQVEL